MKKIITILSSAAFLISCGSGSDNKETTDKDSVSTTAVEAPKEDSATKRGLDLIAQSDCFTCHKLNEAAIGPAYAAVAEKYHSMDKQAATDSIVHQIINGGVGKWGTTPMTAHPSISNEEASDMAAYILSIKKE